MIIHFKRRLCIHLSNSDRVYLNILISFLYHSGMVVMLPTKTPPNLKRSKSLRYSITSVTKSECPYTKKGIKYVYLYYTALRAVFALKNGHQTANLPAATTHLVSVASSTFPINCIIVWPSHRVVCRPHVCRPHCIASYARLHSHPVARIL